MLSFYGETLRFLSFFSFSFFDISSIELVCISQFYFAAAVGNLIKVLQRYRQSKWKMFPIGQILALSQSVDQNNSPEGDFDSERTVVKAVHSDFDHSTKVC